MFLQGNVPPRWQKLVKRGLDGSLDPKGPVWACPHRWGCTLIAYRKSSLLRHAVTVLACLALCLALLDPILLSLCALPIEFLALLGLAQSRGILQCKRPMPYSTPLGIVRLFETVAAVCSVSRAAKRTKTKVLIGTPLVAAALCLTVTEESCGGAELLNHVMAGRGAGQSGTGGTYCSRACGSGWHGWTPRVSLSAPHLNRSAPASTRAQPTWPRPASPKPTWQSAWTSCGSRCA